MAHNRVRYAMTACMPVIALLGAGARAQTTSEGATTSAVAESANSVCERTMSARLSVAETAVPATKFVTVKFWEFVRTPAVGGMTLPLVQYGNSRRSCISV